MICSSSDVGGAQSAPQEFRASGAVSATDEARTAKVNLAPSGVRTRAFGRISSDRLIAYFPQEANGAMKHYVNANYGRRD